MITHGTDRIVQTARSIKAALRSAEVSKTVVLIGALKPERFSDSDAPINFGAAICSLQLVTPGVYVCMHARIFEADNCIRDKTSGVFTS